MVLFLDKQYDLEERTKLFAKNCRVFVNKLPQTISNKEDIKQLVRSSGSIGANYIEANESLGVKDFIMKIKISRKEAKETAYWLDLVNPGTNIELEAARKILIQESIELMKIFGAILKNYNTVK